MDSEGQRSELHDPGHGFGDRDPEHPWIERDTGRRSGQWVIAGSRVTVADVVGYAAAGMRLAEIADDRGVPVAGVEAAIAFAKRQRLPVEGAARMIRAGEGAPACNRCGAVA